MFFFFFFFQAEDGIRDLTVTGVQTCALPIWLRARGGQPSPLHGRWRDRGGGAAGGVLREPARGAHAPVLGENPDRKSTRLNSSHSQISYAVFCLKKKKKKRKTTLSL